MIFETPSEGPGMATCALYEIRNAIPAEIQQRGPYLDAARAPRGFGRVVRWFAIACDTLCKIRGAGRHRRAEIGRCADKDDAAVIGDVEPFMPVRRPGIRLGQAFGQSREVGMCERPEAESPIDMYPASGLPGPTAGLGRRIEVAAVHVARLNADDRAIIECRKAVDPQPTLVVCRDPNDPFAPEAKQRQCLQ